MQMFFRHHIVIQRLKVKFIIASSMHSSLLGESEIETAVGICAYANNCAGFQGIHKQRYSDFVVREVSKSGSVSVLTSTSGSELEARVFGQGSKSEELSPESISNFVDDLRKETIVGNEWNDSELQQFLTLCAEKSTTCPDNFVAFPCVDKLARTKAHQIIRTHLGTYVDSDTFNDGSVQFIRLIAKYKTKGQKKRFRAPWPDGVGNYLQFTLLKENVDTMSACSCLAKSLQMKSTNGIGYAGTKDKRAITLQTCTVYRKRPSEMGRINKFQFPPFVRVGNFSYRDEAIQLGDLGGNRFTIALRSLSAPSRSVAEACQAVQRFGFINYFGLQRFGKGGARSNEIGREVIKGEWKTAIDLLFAPRDGDRQDLADAKFAYARGQYKVARDKLSHQLHSERSAIEGLMQHPNDHLGALNRIPRNVRLLFSHAYQSYLFNKAASERVRLFGLECVEGDLVAVNPAVLDEATQAALDEEALLASSTAEESASSGSGSGSGDKERQGDDAERGAEDEGGRSAKVPRVGGVAGAAVTHDAFQRSEIRQMEAGGGATAVADIRALTAEDVASGAFSIKDVILPLMGSESVLPKNAVGDYFLSLLQSDGLSQASFASCSSQYRSKGAYRRLMQCPKDLEWKIVHYSDPDVELVETETLQFRSGRHQGQGQGEVEGKYGPSIESTALPATSLPAGGGGGGGGNGEMEVEDVQAGIGLRALVLSFTLPPGTYATMLLRELTKESTETLYQAQLTAQAAGGAEAGPGPESGGAPSVERGSEEGSATGGSRDEGTRVEGGC